MKVCPEEIKTNLLGNTTCQHSVKTFYIAPQNVEANSETKVHCTSAKRMTSILRRVAETFPPAMQGTILNSHQVIGLATITSMVLNCALVT